MEFKYTFNKPTTYTSSGSIPHHQVSNGANLEQDSNNSRVDPILFSPIQIKDMELKNRIVVAPMCQYSSLPGTGLYNDWHFNHYGSFAKGGAGLVIFEATSVVPEGRISNFDVGIWSDEHIDGIKRVVDFSHLFDTKVGIQLAHAGRKSSCNPLFFENSRGSVPAADPSGNGWSNVYSPSPIPWSNDMTVPIEMTIKDIEYVIESFKLATIRSIKAGIDFIEIHGAHGYLINSFLSKSSNKRTDKYGGQSFDSRIKFLVEIVEAVRSVWTTDKPLAVRISAEEWISESDPENNWSLEESIKLAQVLESLDVDLIDVSSGGNAKDQKIHAKPLYQVPLASEIKKSIIKRSGKLLVSTVGLITTAVEAESILQPNDADLILFGRAFLRNPHLPIALADELKLKIDYTLQYQPARIRYNHH